MRVGRLKTADVSSPSLQSEAQRGTGESVFVIQSLKRGLEILETIAGKENGLTRSEINRETGLHPSTAYHLLRTLSASGYLAYDDATRKYRIGVKVFQLAATAWNERQLLEVALPCLATLARETGETSHLAVLHRGEVIVVGKIDGGSPFQLNERVGYPRPAHCTALGKVLLAYSQEADQAAFLAAGHFEVRTPKTITAPARLKRELEKVRSHGYAVDDEEFAEGNRCVAVPVRNFTSEVVAAIGISGPVWRVTLDRMAQLAELMTQTGSHLSRQLGCPAPQRDTKPAASV